MKKGQHLITFLSFNIHINLLYLLIPPLKGDGQIYTLKLYWWKVKWVEAFIHDKTKMYATSLRLRIFFVCTTNSIWEIFYCCTYLSQFLKWINGYAKGVTIWIFYHRSSIASICETLDLEMKYQLIYFIWRNADTRWVYSYIPTSISKTTEKII